MTNEERDLITRFIERVGGGAAAGGSVPSTPGTGLAPVDPQADALIGQLMQQYPEARYRITQLAFVQEHALQAAQQRISALQAQLQSAGQSGGGQQPSPWGAGAQPAQPQQHGGLLSSLFGSRAAPAAPPPQQAYQPPPPPQYAQPQYAAPAGGMFQPQGSGFLGGALRTAAGVAGGLVAGQALMSLFEGNRGGGFGSGIGMPGGGFEGGGFGTPGGWAEAGPVSDSSGGFAPDPYDQGGALKGDPASDPYAQGGGDSGWAPAADTSGGDSGWQDSGSDGGGWDTGSNSDNGGWTDSSSDS